MTVEGRVENGRIVLDDQTPLPEGVKVRIEVLDRDAEQKQGAEQAPSELSSLYERMKPFIGSVKDLPPDYAINHDHYLHGQPKRQ
jgi:hypothetical protein